ncbi:unnamed protein product [Linum trigynum]|uniref:Uncharacterized protein n=1 Tax=Linum trigynum TaxID=586398 RepID=A0AAV2GLB5_9ROSI
MKIYCPKEETRLTFAWSWRRGAVRGAVKRKKRAAVRGAVRGAREIDCGLGLADVKCGLVKEEMERPPTTATSTESRFRTGGGGCWRNRLWDLLAGCGSRRTTSSSKEFGNWENERLRLEKLEWINGMS